MRIDERDADRILEAHQPPADQGAVRPRAGPGDVQVVAARLEREAGGAVVGDPGAELAVLAPEGAVIAAFAAEGEGAGSVVMFAQPTPSAALRIV